jgi:hypothetical protein
MLVFSRVKSMSLSYPGGQPSVLCDTWLTIGEAERGEFLESMNAVFTH